MGEKQNRRFQLPFNAALKFDLQGELVASDGHFESTRYHPLLLSGWGDCRAAKLRPGNVQTAEGWDELPLPEIERQQKQGREVVFRADAPFAKPEIHEALDDRGMKYAVRIPANECLESDIAKLLPRATQLQTG